MTTESRPAEEKPDYLGLYLKEVHGDFYGPDYYRQPQAQNESAIVYDDGDDKRTVAALLTTTFAPKRSLEVGCATGLMVKAMRGSGVDAEGFDFSQWCVDSAHPDVKEWVRWGDVLQLKLPDRPYDLVMALDVLEHLPPERVPVALRNIASCLVPGGIAFAVIPAYGVNQFGPEVFSLHRESWRRDAAAGIPFRDLPLDDKGRPHLGHLTHATIGWWEAAFRRAGLRRLGPVEQQLHNRYDTVLAYARRSFFVFIKAAPLGRWLAERRLLTRIAGVPGLPHGFWAWERWGADLWMHWTTKEAWEPIEVGGRPRLRIQAICNHPNIDRDPVNVSFRIDDGPPVVVTFTNHDWHPIDLPVPRARRFVGLSIVCSRTWQDGEAGNGRELGVGLAYRREGIEG